MRDKMNVVYIYADDLGRGMLSCYGQPYFKTPNIDRLAAEGQRFTNAYGCAVCAPARASLLTGYHDCHAGSWSYSKGGIYKELSRENGRSCEEIRELINNTSFNERSDEVFLADIAKQAGLVTGEIGKLSQPGGVLYNIEHSNGGLITFPGGVPIKNAQGVVIGAIGVSGSTVEDDHAVAEAGAAVFNS